MDGSELSRGEALWALATAAVVFFLVLLPLIVAFARSPGTLTAAALTLNVISVAVFAGAAFTQGREASMLFAAPAAAGLWFVALICGIASFFARAMERRARQKAPPPEK